MLKHFSKALLLNVGKKSFVDWFRMKLVRNIGLKIAINFRQCRWFYGFLFSLDRFILPIMKLGFSDRGYFCGSTSTRIRWVRYVRKMLRVEKKRGKLENDILCTLAFAKLCRFASIMFVIPV